MVAVAVKSQKDLREILEAEKARRRLRDFISLAWKVLEPGTPYKTGWHIDAICEHLEGVTKGYIRNLVINVPPGHSKSRTVTVCWPTWEWISLPHMRYYCGSHDQDLSVEHNMERRHIIASEWYQRHFGHAFEIRADSNLKTQFSNDKGGKMIATSVGAQKLGKGGERLIADDPLNPKKAASDAYLKEAENWFRRAFLTRQRDKKKGACVIVMQRLHEKDTAGLALEMGYEHLCLPAEYDPSRSCVTQIGPKTWSDPRTEKGELLWPAHEGKKEIATAKTNLGSYAYAGQYQQLPHPEGGGVFKKEHFRYYRQGPSETLLVEGQSPISAKGLQLFTTCDLAFSAKESADWTVFAVWGFHAQRLYLLDLVRGRLTAGDLNERMKGMEAKWGVRIHWVEEGAYRIGAGTINYLRSQGRPIQILKKEHGASKDKHQRAVDTGPRFEAGWVYFPAVSPWLSELEGELLAFPNASNDDQVDCVAYGVAVAPWDRGGRSYEFEEGGSGGDYAGPSLNRPKGW